jgi:hypothetical protein
VETLAPWFLAKRPDARTPLEAETIELTGPTDRFSLEIPFDDRFAGFDPPALPAPRPAAAVIDRHTAAYWRFDAAGQSVTDGAAVRDLTGKGNNLTVRRLSEQWTGHPGGLSPSTTRTSPPMPVLRFDGGQGPGPRRHPAHRTRTPR